MAQPYVGEIRIFAGNFAPAGWSFCDGSILSISEYDTLFNLIGTTYGGDGESTFALPDLRSRIPIHQGNGFVIAETGGTEEVTLTVNQIPAHSHNLGGKSPTASAPTGNATHTTPIGKTFAGGSIKAYSNSTIFDANNGKLNSAVLNFVGQGQPHTNMMPSLGINYIISLFGLFPSPN